MQTSAKVFGVDSAVRSFTAAKRRAIRGAETAMTRELLRTERDIQRRYRSLSAPGPQGTAVKTGRLRSSYASEVRRLRGTLEIEGKVGLFGTGLLPTYFLVWEGVLDHPGRPRRGAVEAVRRDTERRVLAAVERELGDAFA